jgi:hypothetical protein
MDVNSKMTIPPRLLLAVAMTLAFFHPDRGSACECSRKAFCQPLCRGTAERWVVKQHRTDNLDDERIGIEEDTVQVRIWCAPAYH